MVGEGEVPGKKSLKSIGGDMPEDSGSNELIELGCDMGEHMGRPRGPVHMVGNVSSPASISKSSCGIYRMPQKH